MSHNAALINVKLVKNFFDDPSPFRNPPSRFGSWRVCSSQAPSASEPSASDRRGVCLTCRVPVDGNESNSETLSHLVIEAHDMPDAAQAKENHKRKSRRASQI